MRNRLDWNHDQDEELLHTLIHGLVIAVGQIQTDDLRTCEKLHNNRTSNDWTDTQVHDGTRRTSHDGTETAEQVHGLTAQSIEHDVGHSEVNDENEGCCPHLLTKANVSVRLRDGWVDIDEAAESVQTAALVTAPHETCEDGCCTETKQ